MSGSELPFEKRPANPYVGPRPFETGERIFGRESEVQQLSYLLSAERVVLLHSPSGAGKTSLVQAGLLPRLRERFDVWRPTRVGRLPPPEAPADVNRYVLSVILGFEEGIPEILRGSAAALGKLRLSEYVAQRPRRPSAPENVLLFFDQFEEILTIDSLAVDAKRAFFEQLGELLQNPTVWALFGLREDFLAPLDSYVQVVPTHLRNRYRIDLLNLESARQAITRPTLGNRRVWKDDAADKLVRDLATVRAQQADGSFANRVGLHVEPMHLQVVCRGLWERMPADDFLIEIPDLEAFGNVTGALADYYAGEVARIAAGDEPVERALREWIDQKLISAEGIRTPALQSAESSQGLDNALISRLVDSHLVRTDKRGGATWYELAHDRLIEPVRNDNNAWFENKLSLLQKQAKLWSDARKPESLLLRGKALREAEAWQATQQKPLTATEKEFLQKSLDRRAERRRQTRVNRIVRVLLGVVIVAGVTAIWLGAQVYRSNQTARSLALAAQSAQALATGDKELAVIAGMQAIEREDTPQAEQALAEALGQPLKQIAANALTGKDSNPDDQSHLHAVMSAAFSPDGQQVVTTSRNGAIQTFQGHSGKSLLTMFHGSGGASAATFDPAGRRILSTGSDGSAVIWDAASGTRLHTIKADSADAQLAFGLDGKQICATGDSTKKTCWDSESGQELPAYRNSDFAYLGAYSADGTRSVTSFVGESKSANKLWVLERKPFYSENFTLAGAFEVHIPNSIALSPDGKFLRIRWLDSRVSIHDGETGATVMQIVHHRGQYQRAVFAPDSQRLLIHSEERIAVWDIRQRQEILSLPLADQDKVSAAAISQDHIAAGFQSGRFELWKMRPKLQELRQTAQSLCGQCTPRSDRDRQILDGDAVLPKLIKQHEDRLLALWIWIFNFGVSFGLLWKAIGAQPSPSPSNRPEFVWKRVVAASLVTYAIVTLHLIVTFVINKADADLETSVSDLSVAKMLFFFGGLATCTWPGVLHTHWSRLQPSPSWPAKYTVRAGLAGVLALCPLSLCVFIMPDPSGPIITLIFIAILVFLLNLLAAGFYMAWIDVFSIHAASYRAKHEDDD